MSELKCKDQGFSRVIQISRVRSGPVGPGRVGSGSFQTLAGRVESPLTDPTRPDSRGLTRPVNIPRKKNDIERTDPDLSGYCTLANKGITEINGPVYLQVNGRRRRGGGGGQ